MFVIVTLHSIWNSIFSTPGDELGVLLWRELDFTFSSQPVANQDEGCPIVGMLKATRDLLRVCRTYNFNSAPLTTNSRVIVCNQVYFGEQGNDIIILLCGGDKDSQDKDIQQAKAYWQEYLSYDKL